MRMKAETRLRRATTRAIDRNNRVAAYLAQQLEGNWMSIKDYRACIRALRLSRDRELIHEINLSYESGLRDGRRCDKCEEAKQP
jgi:hypothetical protein